MKGNEAELGTGATLYNRYRTYKKLLVNVWLPRWKKEGDWKSGWSKYDAIEDVRQKVWLHNLKIYAGKKERKGTGMAQVSRMN